MQYISICDEYRFYFFHRLKLKVINFKLNCEIKCARHSLAKCHIRLEDTKVWLLTYVWVNSLVVDISNQCIKRIKTNEQHHRSHMAFSWLFLIYILKGNFVNDVSRSFNPFHPENSPFQNDGTKAPISQTGWHEKV